MVNYYFTFGQGHVDSLGNALRDFWVRVVASSYEEARRLFIKHYAARNLDDPLAWAFQYKEGANHFDKSYFPKGELALFYEELCLYQDNAAGRLVEAFELRKATFNGPRVEFERLVGALDWLYSRRLKQLRRKIARINPVRRQEYWLLLCDYYSWVLWAQCHNRGLGYLGPRVYPWLGVKCAMALDVTGRMMCVPPNTERLHALAEAIGVGREFYAAGEYQVPKQMVDMMKQWCFVVGSNYITALRAKI